MNASRLFHSCFVVVPIVVAAAYAAGCSDDAAVTPEETDDGGAIDAGRVDAPSGDGGNGACASDLAEDGLYRHLSCAGLYANIEDKTLAAELMPYKPSTEFWSDGAEKARFIYFPAGTKIDTSDMNEWVFPVGTKVFKEFKLGGKRIETRLYQKVEGDWKNTTYRWSDDEHDAERLEDGQLLEGLGPDGGVYEIPTTASCTGDCHGGRKDLLLGFDAVSLGLPNATGLTLASLVEKKLLTNDPPVTALAYPTATAAQGGDKAGPAMAWLHVNCGTGCHNSVLGVGTITGVFMQMKASDLMPINGGPVTVDKLEAYTSTVCKTSNNDEVAPNTGLMKLVRSGSPERSWISVISGRRMPAAPTQMPPVATHAVDHVGHQLLDDWIGALTQPCD